MLIRVIWRWYDRWSILYRMMQLMLWCCDVACPSPLSAPASCSHPTVRYVTPELVSHVSSHQNRSRANCSGTSGPASRAWPDLRKLCLEKIISSINSSLRQETIIKGLSCHDSSWTERGGGDLVKVDTITLQPEPGLGHQISHRRGQMVAVNIKILIGPASLWTRVYLHQVRRLEL